MSPLTDQGIPQKRILEECKSEIRWRTAGEQGTHELTKIYIHTRFKQQAHGINWPAPDPLHKYSFRLGIFMD